MLVPIRRPGQVIVQERGNPRGGIRGRERQSDRQAADAASWCTTMRGSRRPARTMPAVMIDACGPKSPDSHRVVWGLTSWPPVPLRAFLRFPVCPRVLPLRPLSSGFPSSGVLRFVSFGRCPGSGSLRFPSWFPSASNAYASAAARRFRRRWSRAAGTKVTSSAATTSPGSRGPPARRMGSDWARWDAATESPDMRRARMQVRRILLTRS